MKSKQPILQLTGVRFLAVLMVFLYHYNPFVKNYNPSGNLLSSIVNEMYAGVGLFFVLSGFLITYNYFKASNFSFDFFRKYMARRFAKIYPVFFIITTVYFIYWWTRGEGGDHLAGVYVLNITFIKGFSQKLMFTGIFQGWSLTVEETFYLLAPLIFLVIRKGFFFSQILFFILTG
ncbi:MAG TPA: acyltransferase, partial [Chitinophagaceae bacterium]|nr:acyltransferase [Chitinophagaceae bacterium]